MSNIRFVLTIPSAIGDYGTRVMCGANSFKTYAEANTARVNTGKVKREVIQVRAARTSCGGLTRAYFDTNAEEVDSELQGLDLACAVLHWAETPGEHGGNPYMRDFVRIARRILNDN